MLRAGEAADFDVRREQIDGVPAFWTPIDGPLTVGLMFRVGRADERLVNGGITHLVEHLALYRLGASGVAYSFNGYVDPVTTVLHAQGDADDVVSFLDEVCRALRDLPLERLETEKSILRSEAAQHGGSRA